DLPLLQSSCCGSGGAFLNILDPHGEGWLEQLDANPNRAKAGDGLQRLCFARSGGKETFRFLIKTCSQSGGGNVGKSQHSKEKAPDEC
ncbi:MAG: hypothetical protein ACKVHP_22690, partial [Verrucomicrobiales bacterium]